MGDSIPERISTRLDDQRILHLTRAQEEWTGAIETVTWQVLPARAEGVMRTSLYESLHDVIPDSILPGSQRERFIADMADGVFGWQIDFSRDIVKGDHFSVVYERLASSLNEVRYGRLIAARIETRGRANTAYLLTDSLGRNAYYDERGISLRRTFLRKPVAFLRISSGFSSRRFHPVLGIYRAHRGTDFAARMGTEVYATGDGVVKFAGRDGGYGTMVSLRHPKGIETRYAHLSRLARGITPGVRVQQGQIVGFVGASGLASGPHVHYEFLKNGRHMDSRRVDFGEGTPVPKARHAEFASVRAAYDRMLEPPAPAASPAPQSVAAGGS
jgi:murein DD-endopeptidase MepM/ murein hydrolase activator NlpD